MLHEMAIYLVDAILGFGYLGIFLLMAIESSFIPFPSEIVLIPAGYLASQGEMRLDLIFLVALMGSMVGAFINYFGALLIGRALLVRYGKYFFISNASLEKMDRFFEKHGHISTFTGRLIPGIRQLISIPAGIAKMDLKVFTLFTALGAGIWSAILIALGYFIGENQELLTSYLHQITLVVVGLIIVALSLYFLYQRKQSTKE